MKHIVVSGYFNSLHGSDRDSEKEIPEAVICREYGIEMRFDAGHGKPDSSTHINQATGSE